MTRSRVHRPRSTTGRVAAAALATICMAWAVAGCDGPDDVGAGDEALRGLTFPAGEAETVHSFDPALAETPESVVVDLDGTLYVSLALTGEIRRIAPDGTTSTVAYLPLGEPVPGAPLPGIMGALALRFDGTLFVSVASADPAMKGIWRVTQDGETTLLANLPPGSLPNGIALRLGQLYVADSALGVIWRVPACGGEAEVWVDDEALLPVPGPIEIAPGANGLQIFRGEVYVANSSSGEIHAYPIEPGGNAGPPRVHATGVGGDDFALDVQGNIFITTDPFNTLLLVRPDGSSEVLLTVEDGLDGPTSCAFGRALGDRRTLYISNAAFPFFPTTGLHPSVMRVDMPLPGAARWPL